MESTEQAVLQKHLAQFLVRDVFNLPEEVDLLNIQSPTYWEYKGRQLVQPEIDQLRKQAEIFIESELWKLIKSAMKHDALNRGMLKSKTEGDQIGAKIEIYFIQTLESILKHMIQTK